MLPKSVRGWLLVLLLVAVTGGTLWEVLTGGVSGIVRRLLSGSDTTTPKPDETAAGMEPVFKALGLSEKEKDRREAVVKEMGKADPAKVAKVAEALRKPAQVNPHFVLGKADPNLALLVPEKAVLSLEQAQAVRRYLAEWRVQLAALRKAAQEAKLQSVSGTALEKMPTLYLLKELATSQPEYDDLPTAGGSDLPFFTADDAKTASALRRLLGEADGSFEAGTLAFAKSRLNVTADAPFRERLEKLAHLAPRVDETFVTEVQAAVMAKLVAKAADLSACSIALTELADTFGKGKKLDPAALPPLPRK